MVKKMVGLNKVSAFCSNKYKDNYHMLMLKKIWFVVDYILYFSLTCCVIAAITDKKNKNLSRNYI